MNGVTRTIISQYANSPRLLTLIGDWNIDIDPGVDLDMFYNALWNVATATGWGLDVWGRIVGVTRYLSLSDPGPFLGFAEAHELVPNDVSGPQPFGQAPFFGPSAVTVYPLSDTDFRALIMTKAMANISQSTAQNLNALMTKLFATVHPGGHCYVIDNNNMTIEYVFNFVLTSIEYAILVQSGVMPKPAGVSVSITYI